MTDTLLSRTPGLAAPWETDGESFFSFVRDQVAFDSFLLGIFHAKRPQTDEVLAVSGIPPAAVEKWCAGGLDHIELFHAARRRGQAMGTSAGAGDAPLAKLGHTMVHTLTETGPGEPRVWFLLVSCKNRAYDPGEQQVAAILLRQWQVAFNQIQNPIVGRMLLGHDDRIIHADLWLQLQMLKNPQLLQQLLSVLHPVVQQRWPGAEERATRDIAVELGGKPFWVRFHDGRAPGMPQAAQRWYLELHPLEEGELTTVGVVEDERIARSIGFIHDNYQSSPSLNEIAEAAHVSPFHFHRLFSRYVGLSPKHYLQNKQLQMARWLLRATRTPIGSIAQQAGFSSHGHFTSTFHRLVGVSPTEYRETH